MNIRTTALGYCLGALIVTSGCVVGVEDVEDAEDAVDDAADDTQGSADVPFYWGASCQCQDQAYLYGFDEATGLFSRIEKPVCIYTCSDYGSDVADGYCRDQPQCRAPTCKSFGMACFSTQECCGGICARDFSPIGWCTGGAFPTY